MDNETLRDSEIKNINGLGTMVYSSIFEYLVQVDSDLVLPTFTWYQNEANKTNLAENSPEELYYLCLGIGGETGEILEKVKKILRNKRGEFSQSDKDDMKKEIGDVLWYLSQFAKMLDIDFNDVATSNITKLRDRMKRNVIASEGDNR